MEQDCKPPKRVPLYKSKRLTPPEFFQRRKTSRQREEMKFAVEQVMVGGVHLSDMAASMGSTRQNLLIGVNRFLRTTETPPVRMAEADFELAARGRRNPDQVNAARLYLVEGYSVAEAASASGVSESATKDMVKRMRDRVRRTAGRAPGPGDVYEPADPAWVRPTHAEIEAMAASCVVRRRSPLAYTRAMLVLAGNKPPREVARMTGTMLCFVLENARKVESEVNQYRAHMAFPKSLPYLVAMRQAVAKRITNPALRAGVERYLGKEANLHKAATVAGVEPCDMERAVRMICHEMARMAKESVN